MMNARLSPIPTPHTGISRIAVAGFKSIETEQHIAVTPLTVLAGANSAGKSSMMQPLLLWKQTLEAPFDPGPLLLNGPCVRFTSTEQFLSRGRQGFEIEVESLQGTTIRMAYARRDDRGLVIASMSFRRAGTERMTTIAPASDKAALFNALPPFGARS